MKYGIRIKRSAEKELDILSDDIYNRIVDKIISLKEEPRPHGSKKLKNKDGYRIRIGSYRVLYTIEEKEIEIYSVTHRKDAYK